jgi:hypothetical protein
MNTVALQGENSTSWWRHVASSVSSASVVLSRNTSCHASAHQPCTKRQRDNSQAAIVLVPYRQCGFMQRLRKEQQYHLVRSNIGGSWVEWGVGSGEWGVGTRSSSSRGSGRQQLAAAAGGAPAALPAHYHYQLPVAASRQQRAAGISIRRQAVAAAAGE